MTAMVWGSRQRRIADFIRAHVSEHGYPPSMREIGDAVGLSSTSSVAHQLRVMEARGMIRRDPGASRAITVLTPPDGGPDAEAAVARVHALCDEWDVLSKGPSPTTTRIRNALEGST